ncbi:RtcB family protein, partial [bacterium]|nr:RtcB family protein [bacterium]
MSDTRLPYESIGPFRYRIARSSRGDMRTDGLMFLSESLIEKMQTDQSPQQVANVATLPGIVGNSLA